MHVSEPTHCAYCPAAQSKQAAAGPVPLWNLPTWQSLQAVDCAVAKRPVGHTSHASASVPLANCPVAQAEQLVPLRNVPGTHDGVGLGVGLDVGLGVGLGVGFGVGLGVGLGVGFGVGDMVATTKECQHGGVLHDAPFASSRQAQYEPGAANSASVRHMSPTVAHCQPLHVLSRVPFSLTAGAAAAADRLKDVE